MSILAQSRWILSLIKTRLQTHPRFCPQTVIAWILAIGTGLLVGVIAIEVFPYHSVNDDEAVYLTQAALLLDGAFFIDPAPYPPEAIRPWFFISDDTAGGTQLYSKYTPVVPAIFALGYRLGFGTWTVGLALIAAGTAGGVYLLATRAFDRTIGVCAIVVLAGSPMFLLTSATFLSYAPTTLLNVIFALAYLNSFRSHDQHSRTWGWAIVAGFATGIAFFARPYTALLFAIPFIIHTLVTVCRQFRDTGYSDPQTRITVIRALLTATAGCVIVAIALWYNTIVTGDPLVFPYAAFAPADGLGFGPHKLLSYEATYTPEMALTTTVTVLRSLATEWVAAGVIGTGLTILGSGTVIYRVITGSTESDGSSLPGSTLSLLLLSIIPAVVIGEAYFWGTYNGLQNGLIDLLGPFYHFDTLIPIAIFAAAGFVTLFRRLNTALTAYMTERRADIGTIVILSLTLAVIGVTGGSVLMDPIAANNERSESLTATYQPIEEHSFNNAVVFTPDTYGDWQAHPFQYLRSKPTLDGPVVYATDGPADRNMAIIDATNRTPYRFTYRGVWTGAVDPVNPMVQQLSLRQGAVIQIQTTVGKPQNVQSMSVRIETDDGYARYRGERIIHTHTQETVTVRWSISPDGIWVRNLPTASTGGPTIQLNHTTTHNSSLTTSPAPDANQSKTSRSDVINTTTNTYANATIDTPPPATQTALTLPSNPSEVDLVVTFVGAGGASITYRQHVPVETMNVTVSPKAEDDTRSSIRVIWPPKTHVCRLTTSCGHEGMWVGPTSETLPGVSINTSATGYSHANRSSAYLPGATQ